MNFRLLGRHKMIALDPNETCELTLALDTVKVVKPTFILRYPTCRETFAYAAKLKLAQEEADDEKAFAFLCEAFSLVVVGWKNVDKPFSLDAIADILTPTEAWELALRIPDVIVFSESEKKKSFLRSQSDTAKDASTTPAPASA